MQVQGQDQVKGIHKQASGLEKTIWFEFPAHVKGIGKEKIVVRHLKLLPPF